MTCACPSRIRSHSRPGVATITCAGQPARQVRSQVSKSSSPRAARQAENNASPLLRESNSPLLAAPSPAPTPSPARQPLAAALTSGCFESRRSCLSALMPPTMGTTQMPQDLPTACRGRAKQGRRERQAGAQAEKTRAGGRVFSAGCAGQHCMQVILTD